jgi:ketosteroid isomerase-like protein
MVCKDFEAEACMGAAENKEIVRDYFAKMNAGQARAAFALLAPDVRYRVIGSTPISAPTTGVDELVRDTLRRFGSRLEGGRLDLTVDELIAEGDAVVALAHSQGRGISGLPYENTYAMVCRVRDGFITAVTEFLDTALVETAIFDKKLIDA